LRTINSFKSHITSISFNEHILTSGNLKGNIIYHDIREKEYFMHKYDLNSPIYCLKWNENGKYLACNNNKNILIYDIRNNNPIYIIKNDNNVIDFDWNSTLLSYITNNEMNVFDVSKREMISTIKSKYKLNSIVWYDNDIILSKSFNKSYLSYLKYPNFIEVDKILNFNDEDSYSKIIKNPSLTEIITTCSHEAFRIWKMNRINKNNELKLSNIEEKHLNIR